MRILLVGGSKSGKSSLAEDLALKLAGGVPAVYWATMEPTDAEDGIRIEKHVLSREGKGFVTVERGRVPLAPPFGEESTVLLDSVTALLANEMFGSGFDPDAPERVSGEILRLSERTKHIVCVADEVFRDGYVFGETTEAYRRGLAEVCRALAADFDCVSEVVCGVPRVMKGRLPV